MLFTCRIAQPDSHALSATRHRFLDYQTSAEYAAGSVLPTWATPQSPEHSHITNPNSLTQPDAKTGGESPPTQKAQRKSSDFRGPEGEFAELQSARVGDEGLELARQNAAKSGAKTQVGFAAVASAVALYRLPQNDWVLFRKYLSQQQSFHVDDNSR